MDYSSNGDLVELWRRFFWEGIILPLVEVTSGGIISGWLVLHLNEVFGLLVNGLEREGIFNDENLSGLEGTSGVIWYFGVEVIGYSIVLVLMEVSGNLNFLGAEAKLAAVIEVIELELTFGKINDGILMGSLLSFEFWENFSILGIDERVSKFVLSLFSDEKSEFWVTFLIEE